ncbi:hypothetical protein L1887_54052 [Cichorium endivia]|nr:hypothetical protein L1887_54052 [Cichorium endivia]
MPGRRLYAVLYSVCDLFLRKGLPFLVAIALWESSSSCRSTGRAAEAFSSESRGAGRTSWCSGITEAASKIAIPMQLHRLKSRRDETLAAARAALRRRPVSTRTATGEATQALWAHRSS